MESKRYIPSIAIDRLSALPDGVVCHILSFLPTKLSVSTSILAKRWRFLWAHVPNLYFDNEEHYSGTSFSNFINRVMLLHKLPNLNTFCLSLTYDNDYDESCEQQLEKCITSAVVVRSVRSFVLDLGNQLVLPRYVFTCKTLVDLRLSACSGIPISSSICLPALKKLRLDSVQFESDESLPRLLNGCPVLEDLTVGRYTMYDPDMVNCYISSPTVKRLKLTSLWYLDCIDPNGKNYTLKIVTPALRYLKVLDKISSFVSAEGLSSLVEVDIILECCVPFEGSDAYPRSVIEFVGGLCNVKCLRLSTGCMKVPDSAFSALTTKFHNLTKLELGADWRLLACILENADNLEVLVIYKVDIDIELGCWMEPNQVPKCLLSHLGIITIDRLFCTEQEYKMVRYLLRNAKVLERMEIYSELDRTDFKAKLDALKKISAFQRGSDTCELIFH